MCRSMFLVVPLALLTAVAGGCGGQYILTVSDQLAPPGGEAVAVVRLQRNDFFVLSLAVEGAVMRFSIDQGPQRGAYTDKIGYAGASVPVPGAVGRYDLQVAHLDRQGDEVRASAPVYVWETEKPIIAADLDSLPLVGPAAQEAQAALARLACGANVLYMTRKGVDEHASLHEYLAGAGYPDGPVLLWQRERWHIVRAGRYKLPRVVVESRLVGQLSQLRVMFPKLTTGVCDSKLAAKAFLEAGLRCVIVGEAKIDAGDAPDRITRYPSWADLPGSGG